MNSSSARTGICAALAIDTLATPDHQTLTIIGAGRVGYYSALYAATFNHINKITFLDIDQTRAAHSANMLAKQFPAKHFDHGQIDARHESDILIIATTSKEPLCHPDKFVTKLIISLGADADDQHEIDSSWVNKADLFVDTMDSVRYGDLRQWKIDGLITDNQLIDLISLLKNGLPSPNTGTKIFISTGTALFDNITIGFLLHMDKKRSSEAA